MSTAPKEVGAQATADVYAALGDWYLRLDGDSATDADQAAFAAWLAESEDRRRAHADMTTGLDRLMAAALDPTAFDGRFAPLLAGEPRQDMVALLAPRRRVLRTALAAAASITAVAGLGLAALRVDQPSYTPAATPVGGAMTVKLDDGSTVYLNTNTRLGYALASGRRSVRLDEGEAYFEVAKDASRPFVVTSGAHTITVVGTAFDVKYVGGVTSLTVTEGVTRVARATFGLFGDGDTHDVKAGMSARLTADGGVTLARALGLDAVGAWRTGQLIYRDQPIAEIVADLGRYMRSSLTLADPARGRDLFTVVLQVDSEPAMLKRMALLLPVTLREVRQGAYEVTVR